MRFTATKKEQIESLAKSLGIKATSFGHYHGCINGAPLRTVILAMLEYFHV